MLEARQVDLEELKSRLDLAFAEACRNYNRTLKKVKISTYLYKALDYTVTDYLDKLIKPAKTIPPGKVKGKWVIDERGHGGSYRKNGKEIFRHHMKCNNINIDSKGLSPDQRKVLNLVYEEDCSIVFIAEFFGISERKVNRIKKKALEILKEKNSHIHIRQAKTKKKPKIMRKEKDISPPDLHLTGPTGLDAA